jgi:WD40 repeat protein/DNA-binding SARP family transcriptional activator
MWFRVLGPLEVEGDGGPVALGGQKERLLLAQLLARPNQVVSVEALIQGLWGDHLPRSAAKTLRSHVVRLRQALEPGRTRGAAGEVLVTRGPGYLLRVAPGTLDTARFEELTGQARGALARGDAEAAASILRSALGLWRGRAFEEFVDSDFAAAESDRLGELRLVAIEDRVEADLQLGRHRDVVAELEGLVREQPLREGLWGRLMLALYRSGRQADALLAYQRARDTLVEELGIEPGADLRRLQTAILVQDPGLDVPSAGEGAPVRELPGELESAGPGFVGRSAELAWLRSAWTRAARGRGSVVLLAGAQGIGKTRLAAELAKEAYEQGGWVLYGRCDPAQDAPLQPFEQALEGHAPLRDVAMTDPERSPRAFGQGLAGLLAGRADRAVLLVLDDLHLARAAALEALAGLAGAAASRPLLVLGAYQDQPAPAEPAALVERLDLRGTVCRRLGPLDRDEVAQVVASYGGEENAQQAASEILACSGGIPLLVHQAAGDWAQARAAKQVNEVAGQTATSRNSLRMGEAKLADNVVDLRELRERAVAHLAAGEGPSDQGPDGRPAAVICPYKGLARFEPSDARFFFGRERLVAELIAHLVGAGLIGVVGPSGSGKSSLVRAGLLPALLDGVLPGSEGWRQAIVRPGEHPMRELARTADRPDTPATLGGSAIGDGAPPCDDTSHGQEADDQLIRAIAGDDQLVLLVDQFEEAFTTCHDEGERAAFLAALTEAAQAPDGYATVVVAVRADYYGRCAEHPGMAALLTANHVLVGPMRPEELRRAIELPARRAGLRLEPGLTDAMLGEVADEPGGLPLLSTALLEGWERRSGRTLTLGAYHQAGGVRGAVARLAERAWLALDPDRQQTARRILLRLAGPGEGEAAVRRRVPLTELTATEDERAQLVLDALADHRLLTKSKDSVELAHEALLREWPRLRGWLEDDVQGRALHRHLIGAAREWSAAGHDAGELYRGARLTAALEWARDHRADLNDLERSFLDAGRAAAEREVTDARRRAEREARSSRRLRGMLASLAAVLVLALVAGGFAVAQRERAQDAALVADARRLGAQALIQSDLDRSLLLAAEAVRLDDSVDTRSALLASLLRSPQAIRVLRGVGNRLQNLTISRNGKMLAAVDNMGLVYLWDAKTGRRLGRPFGTEPFNNFNVPAFSPNGRILATGGAVENGGLVLWEVTSHRIIRRLASKDDVVDAAFSPDGRVLATGTIQGSVMFWDPTSGARLGPVLHPHHPPEQGLGVSLAFAGRGARLYTSASDGKTIVWDVAHRRPVRVFRLGGTLALSPNGKTLALGQPDGSITLADAGTGQHLKVLTGHTAAVARLTFSHDGTTLASVSDDRTAIVWDLTTGEARETLHGHGGFVHGAAFSLDGGTLYTSSLDDSVIAWDLTGTRGLARQLTGAAGHVTGVAFSPHDRNLLALVRDNGPATLWDTARRAEVAELAVSGGWMNSVAFSPDGRLLAAENHADGTVVLFDVATRKRIGQPLHPQYRGPFDPPWTSRDVNAVAFGQDGKLLATAGNDGSTVLWDLATHAPIGRPLRPHPGFTVNAIAFSPDGSMLASGIDDGTVLLTRAPDGTVLHKLSVTEGPGVTALAFSPDGKTLATAAVNGKVRLWDPRPGAARRTWVAQTGPVMSTVFSRDGTVLATSDAGGAAALWDAGSGKQIGAPLIGPSQQLGMAAFDATGHTLATAFQDGTVLLWDVDPRSWLERACAVAGRDLTRQEWQDFLPDRPYHPPCGTR